jgi:group I intron endonuclease
MVKICGIYKITSPSGRVYIGQSVNIKRRFSEYKSRNKYKQPILHRSFKKYGVPYHTFEIIEECKREYLNLRERYWQDFYRVLEGGLNCILTKTDTKPYVYTEESKLRKRGESNGMFGTRGKSSKSKKVICTKTLKIFSSITEASESIGIHKRSLASYLCGKSYNKTNFLYLEDYNSNNIVSFRDKKQKRVIDIETGIIFDSIRKAADNHGIKKQTLTDWLNGRYKNKSTLEYYDETS